MSSVRRQALIDAPLESIWELVGDPSRHPEWWPRVIEVKGQRFEEGDEYVQVTRAPGGRAETKFVIEQRDELREIRMRCELTNTYADWVLTSAQGGTFVDLELGMQPNKLSRRLFDAALGPTYFRRWAEQSLDGLRSAVEPAEATGARGAGAT
jgi:uncharacterized protein YndB with AHSA1/START domain